MGQSTGFLTAGLQLGLESLLVRPHRNIGPFEAQVTIEESHTDDLEITDHPVETGALVTDHAFMRPSELMIRCGWSNSPSVGAGGGLGGLVTGLIGAAGSTISGVASLLSGDDTSSVRDIYAKLLDLQRLRIPFDISTGKRNYDNMLVKSLRVRTDKETENSLIVEATFRQIIIVSTQVLTIGAPPSAQQTPQTTAPVAEKGVKSLASTITNFNPVAAAKSAIGALVKGRLPNITGTLE